MLSLLFLPPGVVCYEQRRNPSSLLIPGICNNSAGAAGSHCNRTQEEGQGQDGRNQRKGKPQSLRGWGLSFPACPSTFELPEQHSLSEQGWIGCGCSLEPLCLQTCRSEKQRALFPLHQLPCLWILCRHSGDISVPYLASPHHGIPD